jgi:hypothetical protein
MTQHTWKLGQNNPTPYMTYVDKKDKLPGKSRQEKWAKPAASDTKSWLFQVAPSMLPQ